MGRAIAAVTVLILISMPCLAAADGDKHALLVGVTRYPDLATRFWLRGPVNDVEMFERILTGERFGFPAANVTTLAGWPAAPAKRPIRENIVTAFEDLIARAGEGDQVVILLAGHGTRQPASSASVAGENDGKDELFLPADAREWDGQEGRVPNALVDDEIAGWLSRLREKGAYVWLIADSCHSGTLMRGSPAETPRSIEPADLGIPASGGSRGGGDETPDEALVFDGLSGDPGLVATYAARADQETPEYVFGGKVYGLFSHHLASVLDTTTTPMTYRELVDRVMAAYRSEWRPSPTPVVEGGGADREVLGLTVWPARPSILLRTTDATGTRALTVDRGRIHGLTEGSVLAVHPPAGAEDAEQVLGYLRVDQVFSLTSHVVPVAYADMDSPDVSVLGDECRCQVEYRDFGDHLLRVAIQGSDPGATTRGGSPPEPVTYAEGAAPPALERAMEHVLQISGEQGEILERASDPAQAEWFVRTTGDRVYLVPRAGWSAGTFERTRGEGAAAPKGYQVGTLDDPDALGAALHDALQRVARATRLLRLGEDPFARARDDRSGIDAVRVELLERGADGHWVAAEYRGDGGRSYRDGDSIAIRWTNDSRQTVDVNVLFVDADLGIQSFFPGPGEICRFGPTEGKTIPITIDTRSENATVGPEQLVFVAVKPYSNTSTLDLGYLEQPALERSGGSRGGADTPLERLLRSAMDGTGETRGENSRELNSYRVRIFAWQTLR